MENVYSYKSNWWGYIGKRVLIAAVAFLVITFLVYTAFHGLWGPDQAIFIINNIATYKELPEMRVLLEKAYSGEGRLTEYFKWLGGLLTGNWGKSIIQDIPVIEMIF